MVQQTIWDLIDGVLVINLDQRTDRWALFQESARGVIPAQKLHRLPARLGRDIPGFGQRPWFRGRARDRTWAARAGAVQSHRNALATARAAGWDPVLILEDDVGVTPEFAEIASALAAALPQQDWQVCYLGYTDPWPPSRPLARLADRHTLFRVHGCNTAHAYLVRAAARDWILEHLPTELEVWRWLATHRAVDRWYRRQLGLHFPVTCISPSVINQTAGFSDIVERETVYSPATGHAIAVPAHPSSPLAGPLRRLVIGWGCCEDLVRGWWRGVNGF